MEYNFILALSVVSEQQQQQITGITNAPQENKTKTKKKTKFSVRKQMVEKNHNAVDTYSLQLVKKELKSGGHIQKIADEMGCDSVCTVHTLQTHQSAEIYDCKLCTVCTHI